MSQSASLALTRGKALAWDITVVVTLAQSHTGDTSSLAKACSSDGYDIKIHEHSRHKHLCSRCHWNWRRVGQVASEFIQELGKRISVVTTEPKREPTLNYFNSCVFNKFLSTFSWAWWNYFSHSINSNLMFKTSGFMLRTEKLNNNHNNLNDRMTTKKNDLLIWEDFNIHPKRKRMTFAHVFNIVKPC